jgi:hypothetical protein
VLDESPELRELKAKLHAAEVNFAREQQKREREAAAVAAQDENMAFAANAEVARRAAEEVDATAALARRMEALGRRATLQQQMYERAEQAWAARAEVAADRAAMDAAAAAAAADIRREAEARHAARVGEKAWVAEFLAHRGELQAQMAAAEAEEDARVAAYAAALDARTAGVAAKKAARLDEEARVFAKLAADAAAAQRAREHMEDLIARLHFEEEEEKLRERAAAAAARAAAQRAELNAAYVESLAAKAAREEREKVEAATFRERMLAKLADDDRLTQMATAKARMKVQEHKREVERLAAIKVAMQAEAAQRDAATAAAAQARERGDAQLVAAERQRLLREHAARLQAYLPKGVAASAEDLELINSLSGPAVLPPPTAPQGRRPPPY